MTMDDVIKVGLALLAVSGIACFVALGTILWAWYQIGKIDDAE